MEIRRIRRAVAICGCICGALTFPASVSAAGAANDAFAAMRVERVIPPMSVAGLVLPAIDGSPIRFADFKGKVVVLAVLSNN